MLKNLVRLIFLGGLIATVVAGWPDIVRFVKIRQVSAGRQGRGQPEKVPAGGRTVYPRTSARSERDGTGDFDAAMRGGPSRRPPGRR